MTLVAPVSNVCTNLDPSVEQPATMSKSQALVCSPTHLFMLFIDRHFSMLTVATYIQPQ